jgi:hypothetical protein
MATLTGTGRIEARNQQKLPRLEKAMEKALDELGYKQLYAGKDPPPEEPEGGIRVELLAGDEGVVAIRIDEDRAVRDVARHVSLDLKSELVVLMTTGALYGRRQVSVRCRKFEVSAAGDEVECAVNEHHTAEVTDIEHNELRALDNAMRSRIHGANDSLLAAEGTGGLKTKKVFRYRREVKKPKFTNARLGRLLEQIETCEWFEVGNEGAQIVVKLHLPGGARGMSYLKAEELVELEAALADRPELLHRRRDGEA